MSLQDFNIEIVKNPDDSLKRQIAELTQVVFPPPPSYPLSYSGEMVGKLVETYNRIFSDKNKDPILVLAKNQEGKIVGFSFCYRENNLVFGHTLGVLENYRNIGIGSKLVTMVEDYYRDRGYNSFEAYCNDSALSFFEKMGFECSGCDSYYGWKIIKRLK